MKRRFVILPILALVVSAFGTVGAGAHQCEDPDDPETCEQTDVMPNWRDGNYIPLFDLRDREDEDQRYDAQRWRDECDNGRYDEGTYQSRQMCFWAYGGSSLFPNRDSEDPTDPNSYSPNEWHMGFAATHCFLQEAAHQCEDHEKERGEGVHDAHGGALYVDVCLSENPDSKYCDDGLEDTQVGVTIMDHNGCGVVVPVAACTDEYHVIRPFDTDYTEEQMTDSAEYIQRIIDDPELYLCGYEQYRSGNAICPAGDDDPSAIGAPGGSVLSSAVAAGSETGSAVADPERHGHVALAMAIDAAPRATSSATEAATSGIAWAVALVLGLMARGAVRARLN